MATITAIREPAKNPRRRTIHLDGKYAMTVADCVITRLGLTTGMTLSDAGVEAIRQSQQRQSAVDHGLRMLERRLHSRVELRRKMLGKKIDPETADAAIEELTRMGYVDDARFARTRAQSQMQYRHAGPRKAMGELLKSGIDADTARAAVREVYDGTDGTADALRLAMKHMARLRRLEPTVARRRLAGMLQRRGFEYDAIKPVLDQVLADHGGGPDDTVADH